MPSQLKLTAALQYSGLALLVDGAELAEGTLALLVDRTLALLAEALLVLEAHRHTRAVGVAGTGASEQLSLL